MKSFSQTKKILVAPLGWGLGHATRCIPIIRGLQRLGAKVLLASDGRALALLQAEFPSLECIELPAYDIRYRTNNMAWNMATQLPKILRAVWREHRAVQKIVAEYDIDGIISDNRFGCFCPKKRSVFLTHQVNILAPMPIIGKFVNAFNHLAIKQFDECWVPDMPYEPNLSGKLSHPVEREMGMKMRYIGALSRMEARENRIERYDAIAVLSGPEPQRTQLEKILLHQAGQMSESFLVVQGKPDAQASASLATAKNIKILPSLTAEALNEAILESGVYIGRSGYSTVMDLARLGKPALLIPTPGQTEQEYLAEKLSLENSFYTQAQHELMLADGIREAKLRTGLHSDYFDENALSNAISALLEAC